MNISRNKKTKCHISDIPIGGVFSLLQDEDVYLRTTKENGDLKITGIGDQRVPCVDLKTGEIYTVMLQEKVINHHTATLEID